MRIQAHLDRRRAAGIGDDDAAMGFEALVRRIGRVRHRRAAGFVIGEQRQQQIGGRRPHAVEMRKGAFGMAEEAQHRHHAVDGVEQRRRRRDVARREGLPQRQQFEQNLDDRAGIAADMAAVGHDLAVELVLQAFDRGFDVARLAGDAERRIAERDNRLHAGDAAAGVARGMAKIAHLAREAAQKAPVEARIGVLQDQRRLAEPGHDAARQHVRAPGQRMPGALQRDPFVDQRAGIGAGDAGLRRAQMPQPAEAQQRRRPVVGRRLHFENRAPIANHDFAGEGEAAGIDFAGPR